MAYIGKSPSQGVRSRFQYQATASQTSFSGSDANGLTLTYTDSLYMDVYQNGILLVPGDDYTATTGTTVVLVQSASLNDIIEMVVYDVFSVNDSVSASSGGTFSSAVTFGGGVVVADGGNICSASDTDAISINSSGVVTFSQTPVGTTFVGTEVASTSGTEVAFTSISSTAKRITLMFREVSLNANEDMMVQLGTSGGLKTSGYLSNSHYGGGGTGSTAGFALYNGGGASNVLSGAMTIYHMGSNKYINSHSAKYNQNNGLFGGGSVELSGTLDRISIKSQGSGSFDAGAINIMIES